jgi:hypothetical protein
MGFLYRSARYLAEHSSQQTTSGPLDRFIRKCGSGVCLIFSLACSLDAVRCSITPVILCFSRSNPSTGTVQSSTELSRAISVPHERQRTAIRFGLEACRKLGDRAETDTEVGRQPGAVRGV